MMAGKIGWIFAGSLYILAMYGIHVMSRDFSTAPRHWITRASIILWPLTVIFGAIGDTLDYIQNRKDRT
jgi:hypothetical protein